MRCSDGVVLGNNAILYVMVIIIIIVEVVYIRNWGNTVTVFAIQNEVETLKLRAVAASDLASVRFLNMASDISLMRNVTQHIINGSLAATTGYVATNYFNAESYSGINASTYPYHSGWYNHRTGNSSTDPRNSALAITSLFRHPWYSVSDSWLAQGFGNSEGMTRFFPLTWNSGFHNTSYRCVSNDITRNNTIVIGYDPTCRQWYADAERAGEGGIIFSSPYLDALSGDWVITLSTPVHNVTHSSSSSSASTSDFYGVLFSDVSMVGLQEFFDGLSGDHTFLIDDEGNLVVSNTFTNGATLQERLYPNDERTQYQFKLNQINQMAISEKEGQLTYEYKGESYIGGFARVQGTGYICGIFVTADQVTKRTEDIKSNGEEKIFIIAYFISYFALYTITFASICLGSRVNSPKEGMCYIGLPLVLLFVSLLAVALPLSLLGNAGVISETDDLLSDQTSETVRQLSLNNGEWLTVYLQSAWFRNLQSLFHVTTQLSNVTADLQFMNSYQDNTVDTALLAQPLTADPRLLNSSTLVSLSDSSWFVTGTTTASATSALSTAIKNQIDNTQLLNEFYRSLYTTNPDFVLTYVGFDTKLFRKYPGSLSTDSTYDPTARSWYTQAMSATDKTALPTRRNGTTSYGFSGTAYTSAYKDAFSGEWLITAARASADSSAVIGGDLLLATVTDIFTKIKFFRTGRATLFDFEDNLVIADRDLKLTSAQATPYSYAAMNSPPVSPVLWNRMKTEATVGPEIVSASDGVEYYIYSAKLTDENLKRYGIMTAVPVAEAREAVEPTLDEIKNASFSVALGLSLSCFFVIIFILVTSALSGA